MKPAPYVWMNGKIVPFSKTKITAFHQGLNYGACIYDGIRSYKTDHGPAIFRLDDHIDRFLYSAFVLNMKLGYTKADIIKAIKNLMRKNKISSGYIRPVAFYSEPKMGINILNTHITFLILVWQWDDSKPTGSTSLYISKYRRLSPASINIKAKIAGYYVNGLLGFLDARNAGYDQPLFLDDKGYLAEGAINNIFIVKKRVLYTPTSRNILQGITRDTIIHIAKKLELKVIEKNIRPMFLKNADEIFLTGTGIQLQQVEKIHRYFTVKKKSEVTDLIQKYYKEITAGHITKYRHWLESY